MHKPNFQLHPNETASTAITRLYRHIRTMKPDHAPSSHYAARQQCRHVQKAIERQQPKLRLVK